MKARRIKGLAPEGPLADNLERTIRVRVDELFGFMPRALNPAEVEALHDLRIAAKRLRYILELSDHLFGPYAATAARRTKDLQDLLGEIHDCDVTLPRVEALIAAHQAAAADAVREAAGDAEDLDAALAAVAPGGDDWRGLHALAIHLSARRILLFEAFLEHWAKLGREGFRARLEYAVGERAAVAEPPTAGASPAPDASPAAGERSGARPAAAEPPAVAERPTSVA